MNIKSVIEFFKEFGEGLLVLTMPTAMFISALILFVYCSEPAREYNTDSDNSNIAIHTIDNHEYLVYHHNNAGGMCHKVNCKFCMAKNSKE